MVEVDPATVTRPVQGEAHSDLGGAEVPFWSLERLRPRARGERRPAHRHDPSVAVRPATGLTAYRSVANQGVKVQRGLLTATPWLTIPSAGLTAFGRINAPEAQPLAPDFQRIAIDNGRAPGDELGSGIEQHLQGDDSEQEGHTTRYQLPLAA